MKIQKRSFDVIFSLLGIFLFGWLIVVAWLIASIETKSNGLFVQKRVGRNALPFFVYKIKTMKHIEGIQTTVTQNNDRRITKSGAFFRKTKVDELPQLFNVLIGDMSFVGPRPDVEGFADKLCDDDRIILSVRPGITGPASLKYKDEETILSQQENAEWYNNNVIWPDKVKINKRYIEKLSMKNDIIYIMQTLIG